jgi:hypothetical protein
MSGDPRGIATCVFCGQTIAPDEPMAGRPPMAGHAACADAALADDRHWDAVADGGGAGGSALGSDREESDAAPRASRAGCLGAVLAGALGLLVVWGRGSTPTG